MGKISVTTPIHARIDILPTAIRSLRDKTCQVDEIIVVSDGSSEDTEKVVKSRSIYRRIKKLWS